MNFGFGNSTTPITTANGATGGSTPNAQAPLSVFSFASGDNKGLTPGTPGQSGAKVPSFGLSFNAGAAPPNATLQLGSQAQTAAPTLSFGTSQQSANVSFGASLPTGSLPFGGQQATSAAQPVATSTLPSFNVGSTLAQTSTPSLGAPASAAPTLSLGPPTSTIAPTLSFNLGNTVASSTAGGTTTGLILGTPLSQGVVQLPTSTSTPGGFSLGKVGTPATSAPTSLGLSLPSTTASIQTSIAPAVSTPTATTATGGFTFAQLEEALNKWTLELEDQGKVFINQALQLNAWDRLVIANGEKIISLNNGIEKVKQQQQQLDHELDFVLAQQRELEDCIVNLEKDLKDVPIVDQDRNHTYQMAENMDTQLKQMFEDLKEVIEHLNESNKRDESNDPVAQVGRILNAHMNSLQWIDRETTQISTLLDQISKMHDMHRRDNERSFHLTYE